MKVFKFDPTTGLQGEQVDEIRIPRFLANPNMASCIMPARNSFDDEWSVSTIARDADNNLVLYPFPVCFCLGQMKAGEGDWFWDWKILLTSEK